MSSLNVDDFINIEFTKHEGHSTYKLTNNDSQIFIPVESNTLTPKDSDSSISSESSDLTESSKLSELSKSLQLSDSTELSKSLKSSDLIESLETSDSITSSKLSEINESSKLSESNKFLETSKLPEISISCKSSETSKLIESNKNNIINKIYNHTSDIQYEMNRELPRIERYNIDLETGILDPYREILHNYQTQYNFTNDNLPFLIAITYDHLNHEFNDKNLILDYTYELMFWMESTYTNFQKNVVDECFENIINCLLSNEKLLCKNCMKVLFSHKNNPNQFANEFVKYISNLHNNEITIFQVIRELYLSLGFIRFYPELISYFNNIVNIIIDKQLHSIIFNNSKDKENFVKYKYLYLSFVETYQLIVDENFSFNNSYFNINDFNKLWKYLKNKLICGGNTTEYKIKYI